MAQHDSYQGLVCISFYAMFCQKRINVIEMLMLLCMLSCKYNSLLSFGIKSNISLPLSHVICVPVSGRKAIYLHDVHVMNSVFHFCKCECGQGYFDSR